MTKLKVNKTLITSKDKIQQVCKLEPLGSTKLKIIGMYDDQLAAVLPYRHNITVYGAAGTGKTVCYSFNHIIQAEKAGESMVIVDSPKLSLISKSKIYLRNRGYDVKAFGIYDLQKIQKEDIDNLNTKKTAIFILTSAASEANNGIIVPHLIRILNGITEMCKCNKGSFLPVNFIFDDDAFLSENITTACEFLDFASATSRDIASFLINVQYVAHNRVWKSMVKMTDTFVLMRHSSYIDITFSDEIIGSEIASKLIDLKQNECIVKVKNSIPIRLNACRYFDRKEGWEINQLSILRGEG